MRNLCKKALSTLSIAQLLKQYIRMKTTKKQIKPQLQKASRFYSDKGFWNKISKFAKKATFEALEKVLILYYCFKDPATPAKEKSIILAALGYFIMPIDAIPDILPGGLVDDLSVLTIAIAKVTKSISDWHIEQARRKLNKLRNKD
ncbi:MAG: hypothetical protein CMP47_00905 [Rickettsiales bacterium]|nr:hypothetical protein [Rickettsiales bacterium]